MPALSSVRFTILCARSSAMLANMNLELSPFSTFLKNLFTDISVPANSRL